MNVIETSSGVRGYFKFEAARIVDGVEVGRRTLADWFPNLITDQGLDRLGNNSGWAQWCQVGSGNTPPTNSDTSMEVFVAATQTMQAVSTSAQTTPPYYASAFKTYRFSTGTAAGNLSEVGIAWTNSSGSLFSRALIVDGSGTPITITVLSDEVLDVTYELRVYPPALSDGTPIDVTGTINISGIDYDYTLRAAKVTTGFESSGSNSGWGFYLGTFYSSGQASGIRGNGAQKTYTGALGAITTTPASAIIPDGVASTATNVTYSSSSLQRAATLVWDLNNGNDVAGIRCILYAFQWCVYQIEFDPAIPKDNTKRLTIVFRHSWARATIP